MKRTAQQRKASFSKSKRSKTAQTITLPPSMFAASPEMKFLDTTVAATVAGTGGSILSPSLNIVPQDNTQSGRSGRKITIRSLMLRGAVTKPTTVTATTTSEHVRVILYQDKQTNGAAATVTGILASANWRSFNNLSNKSRFKIHKDWLVTLNNQSGSWDGTNENYGEVAEQITFFKKLNVPIEFDDSVTTGAIGSQRTNNFGVLIISQSGLGTVDYIVRIRYTDY